MANIELTKGYSTIVDDDDFEWLNQYSWYADRCDNNYYVSARINGKKTRMHRFILSAPIGILVDHINTNTLDNRRSNLRLATKSQNDMNRRKQHNKSSIYKGVRLIKKNKHWSAQIKLNGQVQHLGTYTDEVAAAQAYNNAAINLFGEYARLNEIDQIIVSR